MPLPSTTTPSTRKRKAAEAALADDNQPLTRAATQAQAQGLTRNAAASGNRSRKKPFSAVTNTPPNKSSASESTETERASPASSGSQKKRDLATPASTTGSMDSDDEMLSDVSSQDDFLDTQISEDESLGEGTLSVS